MTKTYYRSAGVCIACENDQDAIEDFKLRVSKHKMYGKNPFNVLEKSVDGEWITIMKWQDMEFLTA